MSNKHRIAYSQGGSAGNLSIKLNYITLCLRGLLDFALVSCTQHKLDLKSGHNSKKKNKINKKNLKISIAMPDWFGVLYSSDKVYHDQFLQNWAMAKVF